MIYFAYGSNLNHNQMRKRCKDSKYLYQHFLQGYEFIFCSIDREEGYANLIKNKDSQVHGCLWSISGNDEKELDYYEGYPNIYNKDYFQFNNQKVMFYIIKNNFKKKPPNIKYLNTIRKGYNDCELTNETLKKILLNYNIYE